MQGKTNPSASTFYKDQFASNTSESAAVKQAPTNWNQPSERQAPLRGSRMHFLFTILKNPQPPPERRKRMSLDDTGVKGPAIWWSQTGSNRRPHACKARALPTELWPQRRNDMVGLGRLELPTSRLSSARSNQLSYKPERCSSELSSSKEERETKTAVIPHDWPDWPFVPSDPIDPNRSSTLKEHP